MEVKIDASIIGLRLIAVVALALIAYVAIIVISDVDLVTMVIIFALALFFMNRIMTLSNIVEAKKNEDRGVSE